MSFMTNEIIKRKKNRKKNIYIGVTWLIVNILII